MSRHLRVLGACVASTLALASCEQLAGVRELTVAATGASDASPNDGDPRVDGSSDGAIGDGARCFNLRTDPLNCGQCGRQCDTGGCSDGVCESLLVARDTKGAGSLAQEATYLYWSIEGPSGVIHGGHKAMRDQVPAVQRQQLPYAHALAYSPRGLSGFLYWAEGNGATPSFGNVDGCAATVTTSGCSSRSEGPLALLQRNVTSIAVEANSLGVAWNDESDEGDLGGSVFFRDRVADGKTITVAGSLHRPRTVALDRSGIYFTVREGLAWCPRGGCTLKPQLAHLGDAPADKLAIDGQYAYVSTGGPSGQIWRVALIEPLSSTFIEQAVLLADDQPQVTALAASGGAAYWATRGAADGDGTILRATGPGKPLVLAKNQDDPTGIVVDDKAAYWSTRGTKTGESRILRVSK